MFIDLLRKRRSVRTFTKQPINKEVINQFIEALLRSPTSRGVNPWNFIFITSRSLLKKISLAKSHGSAFLAESQLAVVITGNEMATDVWIEDCSIAAINLQLTAVDNGLGTCWAQIRNRQHSPKESSEEYVRRILGIPQHLRVGMIIGIGYTSETAAPSQPLDRGKVWRDTFGNPLL